MRGRKWTPEETEIVRQGFANGVLACDIAPIINRSKSAIFNQARAMGFTHKLTCSEAARRYNAVLSEDDIRFIRDPANKVPHWRKTMARRFNVAPTTISHALAGRTWGHLGKI